MRRELAGQTFAQFLKRPEVAVEEIAPLLRDRLASADADLG